MEYHQENDLIKESKKIIGPHIESDSLRHD